MRKALLILLLLSVTACGGGGGSAADGGTSTAGATSPASGGATSDAAEPTEEATDGTEGAADATEEAGADPVTLSVAINATRGGQGDTVASWMFEDVVPSFEEAMAAAGTPVEVEVVEGSLSGDDYKTQLALDLSAGAGPDVTTFDQFWVGEFAAAGYLEPLEELVGAEVADWEGWDQMPEAVQGSFVQDGERYGLPFGTDGRVLYYNRQLFAAAGLPEDWQPTSWDEIVDAAEALGASDPEIIPVQLNAGAAAGEATTLQGVLPMLLGTGEELYDDGWLGESDAWRQVLTFYRDLYDAGLADVDLQLLADGRDRSFELFSQGQVGILLEGDYFWRAVVDPETGTFPMADRDEVVGYALIPAAEPGAGIRGQDFVSASGGTGYAINPATEHPELAWALLQHIGSAEVVTAFTDREPRITAREDVNATAVADSPLLRFVAEEVLPLTWYRPGFETYPQVSEVLARTAENVVTGRSDVDAAVAELDAELVRIAGEDDVRRP